MRNLWRLATASWWANPGRTLAAVLSVAIGVGIVVANTNLYETARRALSDEVASHWLGSAHISIHPPGAHWGSLDASLSNALRKLNNVAHVTGRLQRRARFAPAAEADRLPERRWTSVDAIGIVPKYESHFRVLPDVTGRMLTTSEQGVAVLERSAAETLQLDVGDDIVIVANFGGRTLKLTIVGLFRGRRIAKIQQPVMFVSLADAQLLKGEVGVVSAIDIKLTDASPASLTQAKEAIEKVIADRKYPYPYRVESAIARQQLLGEAERVTRLLLMLIAFVSMLTSFFIILTTQGVSLFLRRRQLGTMRCVGLTRGQLVILIFLEITPLGIIGTIVGIAMGSASTWAIATTHSDFAIIWVPSWWGVALASASGILTTLLSAVLLVFQVGGVSPLDATRAQAHPPRLRYVYMAGMVGVSLLAVHQLMVGGADRTLWLTPAFAITGTAFLHLGYALLAPVSVVLLGRPIARGVGRLVGLHRRLSEEPIVHAPWRSTAACWVLMVGLSLIVYTAVRSQGVLAIWDFPAKLPTGFVWSPKYVSPETIERVSKLPGVRNTTVLTDVPCEIETDAPTSLKKSLVEAFLRKLTRPVFVAAEPQKLHGMVKIAFVEGERDDALAKAKQGGYVIIPTQTSRNKNLHLGDRVTITIGRRSADFEIAAVIESPALDLAVTSFRAESYMEFATSSAIIGTRADLQNKFGLDGVSMFLCDIELPPITPPPNFDPHNLPDTTKNETVARIMLGWRDHLPLEADVFAKLAPTLESWLDQGAEAALPPEARTELHRFSRAIRRVQWTSDFTGGNADSTWTALRDQLALLRIASEMDRPDAIAGSVRGLTQQIEASLRRTTTILTWLPAIILVIAVLGIANLMTVSVQIRTRQIAALRAVGALKSQIVRMVFVEAATIGLLGSVLGVALGLHEAHSVNEIAANLINVSLDFIVPIPTIAAAVGLTVLTCLIAGVAPARHAARNNIVDAMQVG